MTEEEPTSPRTEEAEHPLTREVVRAWMDHQQAIEKGRPTLHRCAPVCADAIVKRAFPEREAAAASLDVLAMAKWIRQHYIGSIDHACSECVPDGSMVVPGFVCAPHIAARLDEGSATPTDTHDLPGHKAHECHNCGNWTEGSATPEQPGGDR